LTEPLSPTQAPAAPLVEFVVTGDEVVRGTIADTNTAWSASRLHPLGLRLRRTVVVGDRGEDIRRALLDASARADYCIVSGGLGPTSDDLTAECAAQAAGVRLQLDQGWLDHLRTRWAARRTEPMPLNNERQAWLPETAKIIHNPEGSAPAFALTIDRCTFFFLPGVPREYQRIMIDTIVPWLAAAAGHAAIRTRFLQCTGISESALDAAVRAIREAHPEVRFGFRTRFPENHLSLVAVAADGATAEANLARVEHECRLALGAHVYGSDGVTFAQALGEALVARGQTIATAESCTGGLAGELLTEVGGSSAWYLGGCIAYSNEAKQRLLGVPAELLATHGAVSEPVSRAMAEGARDRLRATWAIAITGVAGPGGATPDKPVGTVWLACSGPTGTVARLGRFQGDRAQIRLASTYGALQLVREELGIAPSTTQ
jgi:nicotinamide-nucleotide amidase